MLNKIVNAIVEEFEGKAEGLDELKTAIVVVLKAECGDNWTYTDYSATLYNVLHLLAKKEKGEEIKICQGIFAYISDDE